MSTVATLLGPSRRFAISIPDNTGNGSTILALIKAQGYDGPDACYVVIAATIAGVAYSDRGAFVAASPRPGIATGAAADFTTHGQPVAAGVEYFEPNDSPGTTFVRSTTAAAVPALAKVFF